MNKRIPRILVYASLLFLSGCGGGRILYLFEQPYWSTLGGNGMLEARLDVNALSRGKIPVFDLTRIGADPHIELTRVLASGRFATVVVGPLLSLDTLQIARDNPRVRFILVHATPRSLDVANNVTVLTFDRREVLRTAGTLAARVAERQTPAGSDASLAVGVLTTSAPDFSAEEIEAFRAGVTSESHVKDLAQQTVSGIVDAGSVQAALAGMRKNGVQVFLLSLGAANPLALDAMKKTGGLAVVADWARARLDPAQVLLSVETEEAAGIMSAVAAKNAGLVMGTTRLVLGGAGPIPGAERVLLDGQR